MPKKHTIDGIEVELDDDINPEEVERHGAESRDDDAVDWDQVERDAADESHMTEAVDE